MACRNCKIPIAETVCQVCEAIEAEVLKICKQCGALQDDPRLLGRFCHVCNSMYEIVRGSRWLSLAQTEWIHENFELARRKRSLMGQSASGLPDGPEEGTEKL